MQTSEAVLQNLSLSESKTDQTPALSQTTSDPVQSSNITLNEILENIGISIDKICCYGSCNLNEGPEKINQAIIKLVTPVLVMHQYLIDPTSFPKDKAKVFDEIAKRGTLLGVSHQEISEYVKISEVNQSRIFHPKLIFLILNTLLNGSKDVKTDHEALLTGALATAKEINNNSMNDLYKVVAVVTYEWSTKKQKQHDQVTSKGKKYLCMLKQEASKPIDRQYVFDYIVRDVKTSSIFGIGNCQIQAECAFLFAIQQLEKQPIRYVHFEDPINKKEELCAIVIGDFPKPGCTILVPWYDNKPIIWQGSLSNTPELKGYTKTNVLFTIKNEQGRLFYKDQLDKQGFNATSLLQDPQRAKFLKCIKTGTKKIIRLQESAKASTVDAPDSTTNKAQKQSSAQSSSSASANLQNHESEAIDDDKKSSARP